MTLGELGQIYVSIAALRRLLPFLDGDQEEARRTATRWLARAKIVREATDESPCLVRFRSYPLGVDVSARVIHEDGLLVVVAANARPLKKRR